MTHQLKLVRYRVGETSDGFAVVFDDAREGEQFCLVDPDDCLGGMETAIARATDIAEMFNAEALRAMEERMFFGRNPALVNGTLFHGCRPAGFDPA